MVPIQKAASPSPTNVLAMEEIGDAQQSGRSASNLYAERAAHEALSRNPDRPATSPNLGQQGPLSHAHSTDSDSVPSVTPTSNQKRLESPYVPSKSSPLHLTTTTRPTDDQRASDEQSRGGDGLQSPQTRHQSQATGSPGKRQPPPRPLLPQARNRPTPEQTEMGPRVGGPLTFRDLGSDYTRYFNPFTDSARNSLVEGTTTPTPRNQSSSRLTSPLLGANPFATPNASTTKINVQADPEKNAFLLDDRLAAPYDEKGTWTWPMVGDQEEDDDDMHLPQPDDDIRYKAKFSDHFSRANISSTMGLFLMAFGLLFVFVGLPVLSAVGVLDYNSAFETPLSQMPKGYPTPEPWAIVNNRTYPLLRNVRTGLIDPDTPNAAKSKKGAFGDEYVLVFSDEFNDNNRTFYEGDDPYWFAPDIWYGATQDLDWYDPAAVTTWDGVLELRLDKFPNHGVDFRSGMLNSWNHLCFKGGIFEVSVSLPGPAAIMGLWPGVWTMGNLGRPGYLSTTEGLWPYTYNDCDVGITPNQSSYDGLSRLPGQRLPSCTCPGEDHPTPGKGRGAPEIDIIEAGASYGGLPIATQSYQVAPFDIWYYPDYEFTEFPNYNISYTNGYTGGPFQQAISATTNLNTNWYDGKQYQKYSFEYVPGQGADSYITWRVGDETTFHFDGRAIGPNGNIQSRQISEEPMSLVLNLGFSTAWTAIDFAHLVFPTVMRVDYVRWYQKKDSISVTCDPPGYETTKYIKDHINAYTNPNFTKWEQTGHPWPKHKLNTDC